MERPSRGPEELSNWAQWWPHLVHPWNTSASALDCIWGLCVDNAITGSRPWQIHKSRVQILSEEAPQACLAMPGPVIEEVVPEEPSVPSCEQQATDTDVHGAAWEQQATDTEV